MKIHHFGKCSHLKFLYIIEYKPKNSSWRPHETHRKMWGRDPSISQD